MVTAVPRMLEWARALQAVAQSGLAWEPHAYDRERYEEVRRIAAEMLAHPDGDAGLVHDGLRGEWGQATPKVDVRAVVVRDGAVLLVRERAGGRWSLPGGWADVGESPSEAAAREALEESGYHVRPTRLLALHDRDRHGYPPHQWHIWKALFLCELEDGEPQQLGGETTDARFFPPDALPELRFGDATAGEIRRMLRLVEEDECRAQFD